MSITTFRIYRTRIIFFFKSLFTRIGSEKTYSEAIIRNSDKPSIFLIIVLKIKLSATKVLASQSQKIENITRIITFQCNNKLFLCNNVENKVNLIHTGNWIIDFFHSPILKTSPIFVHIIIHYSFDSLHLLMRTFCIQ